MLVRVSSSEAPSIYALSPIPSLHVSSHWPQSIRPWRQEW